jgi:hypothetical protein
MNTQETINYINKELQARFKEFNKNPINKHPNQKSFPIPVRMNEDMPWDLGDMQIWTYYFEVGLSNSTGCNNIEFYSVAEEPYFIIGKAKDEFHDSSKLSESITTKNIEDVLSEVDKELAYITRSRNL